MSDTPRTDAALAATWQSINVPHNPVPTEFARQLERELSNMTDQRDAALMTLRLAKQNHERELAEVKRDLDFKARLANEAFNQRDRLAEALRGIASGLYSWQCCVDEIAPQALAAVEGGEP